MSHSTRFQKSLFCKENDGIFSLIRYLPAYVSNVKLREQETQPLQTKQEKKPLWNKSLSLLKANVFSLSFTYLSV